MTLAKKYILPALTLLVLTLLTGCVTNNGDIGRYYGVWALDRMTVDGADDTSFSHGPGTREDSWTCFSFQNSVVCIARYNALQDRDERWGTWSEDGKELTLDFTHRDDSGNPDYYTAPAWILMEPGTTVCRIEAATDRAMTLSFTDTRGRRIVYYLRKTY